MSGTVTVTAKVGPAITVTAQVITNVTLVTFDFPNNMMFVTANGTTQQFALPGTNTITMTASGGAYALTVA